jgi:NAD(P)H-hydrate repair Nnr-like enzyme with NAD(P)H-hydrate dehydratase domain
LAARGADPLSATLWGAWVPAAASQSLARSVGSTGFLARELVDEIPRQLDRYHVRQKE